MWLFRQIALLVACFISSVKGDMVSAAVFASALMIVAQIKDGQK